MSIIYLIECRRDYETVYKIGYSKKSASRRLDSLQTGNDGELKIINTFHSVHQQQVERTLQRFFAHEKIKQGGTEWFRLDLEDVQNFSTMCQKIENNLNALSQNEKLL